MKASPQHFGFRLSADLQRLLKSKDRTEKGTTRNGYDYTHTKFLAEVPCPKHTFIFSYPRPQLACAAWLGIYVFFQPKKSF
ncbi:MAG: hypothetical protein ACUVQT_06290 [bacterium]